MSADTPADLRQAIAACDAARSCRYMELAATVRRLLDVAGAALPLRSRLQGELEAMEQLQQLREALATNLRLAETQERIEENARMAREAVRRRRENLNTIEGER